MLSVYRLSEAQGMLNDKANHVHFAGGNNYNILSPISDYKSSVHCTICTVR